MKRLHVQLVVAFVSVTLLAIALTTVPQVSGIVRENLLLPAAERSSFSPGRLGRAFFGEGYLPPGPFGRMGMHAEQMPGGPVNVEAINGNWVAMHDMTAFIRSSLESRAALLAGSVLLALAAAVVLALVLAQAISRPIRTVATAADRVAAGDLSVRVPSSQERASRGDETARLGLSFNVMADGLERLERQRKDMVADVAHELRTPLTVLRGRLEAVQDGVVPFDPAEVDDMLAQVLLLTRLVEDLQVLSMADSGHLTLNLVTADLAELVRTAAAAQEHRAADKGLRLVVTAPEPLLVRADRERLLQVLGNLLDNAVRHTPVGGTITLSARRAGDDAVISVADTGPGVPESECGRVFERFYRADGSRGRSSGGSGLGLSIVKAIVELHKGRVAIDGAEGNGTEITVTLPASGTGS